MIIKKRAVALAVVVGACAWFGQVQTASAQVADPATTAAAANDPAVSASAAPTCVGWGAISSVSYDIDGTSHNSLSSTTQGSKITANFVVRSDCSDVTFGLAAYEAPSAHWDPTKAAKQSVSSKDTGTFSTGAHSLTVTVPSCYYQVDFFTGPVFEKLSSSVNYTSEGRLISFTNGGTKACVEVAETSTTTTRAPATTTTTVGLVPVTEAVAPAAAVLGETVEKPAEVKDVTLARTGFDAQDALLFGGVLVLAGAALAGTAASRRRYSPRHSSN